MRFIGVVFSVCGAAALVTGCSVGGGESAEEESVTSAVHTESEFMGESENPAAFHFDSGDLVIGPFDPEEVKGNLFDPCAEISDAELAEVGLAKSEVQPDQGVQLERSVLACSLASDDPYETIQIFTNAVDRELLNTRSEIGTVDGTTVPGAFSFGAPGGGTGLCDTGVETQRGLLSVSVGSVRTDPSFEDLCVKSATILNQLFSLEN